MATMTRPWSLRLLWWWQWRWWWWWWWQWQRWWQWQDRDLFAFFDLSLRLHPHLSSSWTRLHCKPGRLLSFFFPYCCSTYLIYFCLFNKAENAWQSFIYVAERFNWRHYGWRRSNRPVFFRWVSISRTYTRQLVRHTFRCKKNMAPKEHQKCSSETLTSCS